MLSAYPACFIKEENGYSVIFTDLNVATCGDTLDEAFFMATDCLAGYLYTLKEENEIPPQPSLISEINSDDVLKELECENCDCFISMITVDVEEYANAHFKKSVKKMLTIPAWLNAAALEQNINFSQVLQEALKEKIHAK